MKREGSLPSQVLHKERGAQWDIQEPWGEWVTEPDSPSLTPQQQGVGRNFFYILSAPDFYPNSPFLKTVCLNHGDSTPLKTKRSPALSLPGAAWERGGPPAILGQRPRALSTPLAWFNLRSLPLLGSL